MYNIMSVLFGGLSYRQVYLPYSTVPQQPAFDPPLSSIKMWPGPLHHHHVQCRTSGSCWFSIVYDEAMTGPLETSIKSGFRGAGPHNLNCPKKNCSTVHILSDKSSPAKMSIVFCKRKVLLQIRHLTVFISHKSSYCLSWMIQVYTA